MAIQGAGLAHASPWALEALVGSLVVLFEARQVGTSNIIARNPKSSAQHPVVSQQGEPPGSAYVRDFGFDTEPSAFPYCLGLIRASV